MLVCGWGLLLPSLSSLPNNSLTRLFINTETLQIFLTQDGSYLTSKSDQLLNPTLVSTVKIPAEKVDFYAFIYHTVSSRTISSSLDLFSLEQKIDTTRDLPKFQKLADQLMNQLVLKVKSGKTLSMRILDIEFYRSGLYHRDPFYLPSKEHIQWGQWTFSRAQSGEYYKGPQASFGITFGEKSRDEETFGFIQICALENLDTKEIIEGPALCVKEILTKTGASDIKCLLSSFNGSIYPSRNSLLYLKAVDKLNDRIFTSPRNNCSLKTKNFKQFWLPFYFADYRFTIRPNLPKALSVMVFKLLTLQWTDSDIIETTGIKKALLEKYKSFCQQKPPQDIDRKLTVSELYSCIQYFKCGN